MATGKVDAANAQLTSDLLIAASDVLRNEAAAPSQSIELVHQKKTEAQTVNDARSEAANASLAGETANGKVARERHAILAGAKEHREKTDAPRLAVMTELNEAGLVAAAQGVAKTCGSDRGSRRTRVDPMVMSSVGINERVLRGKKGSTQKSKEKK